MYVPLGLCLAVQVYKLFALQLGRQQHLFALIIFLGKTANSWVGEGTGLGLLFTRSDKSSLRFSSAFSSVSFFLVLLNMQQLYWVSCFPELRAKFTEFVHLTFSILRNNFCCRHVTTVVID